MPNYTTDRTCETGDWFGRSILPRLQVFCWLMPLILEERVSRAERRDLSTRAVTTFVLSLA